MSSLKQIQTLKLIFLLTLSMILTSFTLVLGAAPMRVIRKTFSRKTYWLSMLLVIALNFFFVSRPIAIAMALLASLVGLYSDAEESGSGFFAAGFFASLTTSSFALVAAAFWASKKKIDLIQVVQTNAEQVLLQLKSINPQINWTTESLVYQVPSAFVIFLLASLAIALVCDRGFVKLLGLSFWKTTTRSLTSFKVPDLLVWFALFAVAGAYGQQKYIIIKSVCDNVVNVLAMVYFFQSLAIAKHFFTMNRVSWGWQFLGFLFLLVQWYPASLLGFSDYWINYRTRFTKKRQSETPFKSEN